MSDVLVHARDHLVLCACALAVALVLGIASGFGISRTAALRELGLGVVNLGRVVPSLAVLALMIPLLGVGFRPALVALILLAIPPIAINTDLGLRGVAPEIVESALGTGMSPRQVQRLVVWPLALPLVFAGIRTATVEVIASATLAAFIGGGGLGELIINGLAGNDVALLLEGAASVAILALAAEAALASGERRIRAAIGG